MKRGEEGKEGRGGMRQEIEVGAEVPCRGTAWCSQAIFLGGLREPAELLKR